MRIQSLMISAAMFCLLAIPTGIATAAETQLPNLLAKPENLTASKTSIKAGDIVTLKATIKNNGQSTATNVKVKLFIDGKEVYQKTITSLAKLYGTSVVSYAYTVPPNASGAINFKALVDPEKIIAESDETDNEATKSFALVPTVRDLAIDYVKIAPSKPKVGQQATFTIRVTNKGNVVAPNVKLVFYANNKSDLPTATIVIPKISANAGTVKTVRWTMPNGIEPAVGYTVRAQVDPENTLNENNENNNSKNLSFNLTAPDIILERGINTYVKGNLYKGVRLAQWARVRNDNVLPVSNAKIALYYRLGANGNEVKLSEQPVGTLNKKSFVDVYIEGVLPSDIPLGTVIHVALRLDPSYQIVETDESNNELTATRTLVERPQQVQYPYLRVTVRGEDGNPMNGATVKITNTATNVTETKTTGSESYYYSTGNVIFESRPDSANYRLEVTAPGYRTFSESFAYDKYIDSSTERQVDLDKKALVTGTVKDQNGIPLGGVKIRIQGTGMEAVSDYQGKYGFLLNGGTYSFRYVKNGFTRLDDADRNVTPLSVLVLDKSLTPATIGYVSGIVTDDTGSPLSNADIWVNGNLIRVTGNEGTFGFQSSPGTKKITIKKPGYVTVEFSQIVEVGEEYDFNIAMGKPSTDTHVERGTSFVSWHQHEGTPANTFWIPEYNVDVWWGIGRAKMALDFNKSDNGVKLTKLLVQMKGDRWDCHKVEGSGEVETSAIDIPITIAAGGCSNQLTQINVSKVAIYSDNVEVWSDDTNWNTATDPMNVTVKTYTLPNVPVSWNGDFKIKVWARVMKRSVVGTDGDGAGALVGYHLDKKAITWSPQKPPTTKITTSWGQIGGYFLGILDNPVNAVAGFTDLYTAEQYNQFEMEEVLPQNYPD